LVFVVLEIGLAYLTLAGWESDNPCTEFVAPGAFMLLLKLVLLQIVERSNRSQVFETFMKFIWLICYPFQIKWAIQAMVWLLDNNACSYQKIECGFVWVFHFTDVLLLLWFVGAHLYSYFAERHEERRDQRELDLALLASYNAYSRHRHGGLTEDQIATIPRKQVTVKDAERLSEDTCAICLLEFETGNFVKELRCQHIYHDHCISEWLQINALCPSCKSSVR